MLEIDSRYSSFMNVFVRVLGRCFSVFHFPFDCAMYPSCCRMRLRRSITLRRLSDKEAQAVREAREAKRKKKKLKKEKAPVSQRVKKIERIFRNPTTKINDHFKIILLVVYLLGLEIES